MTLEEIYEEMGGTAKQLHAAAVRRGLQVSMKQVRDFVARQAETQTFKPGPTSQGKELTRQKDSDLQADIIDLKTQKSGPFSAILIVINPWNRKVALEPLRTKTPTEVTEAFKKTLTRLPKPDAVSTDQDNSFKTAFNLYLENEGIVHKYKDPRQLNSIAVLDAATKTIKVELFKKMTRQNKTKWDGMLKQLETAYNDTIHGSLNATPNDLDGDDKEAKVLQFQREKTAAANIQHNNDMIAAKTQKIEAAGAYREMAPRAQWQRAYKPRWSNEIKGVREIKAGQVVAEDGKVSSVSTVQPVPQDTVRRDAPDLRGRGLRDETNRKNLRRFALDLYDALFGEISLTSAARLMPDDFAQTKPSTLLFSNFLALFPNLFKVSGSGPSQKVRAIRKRKTSKQRA